MAVFPDRIVLKNSTDSQAAIETAIGSGGSDEIQQGELVIGRESGAAKLYTVDSAGNIAVVGGSVESIDDLTDVDTSTTPPSDGQALVWVAANSNWEPGNTVGDGGGRGDGGDFDTGTIDSAFTFGIYGGGDLDAGTGAGMVAFAYGRIDVNNVTTTATHSGMSSAAHVYSAGVSSYINFTFDTAQPDTEYSVQATWMIGPELVEISNKTVNGFRANFYDMSTGNEISSGGVGIGEPIFVVYASDPTTEIGSGGGTDLPVELLGSSSTPDGGDIT